MIKVSNLPNIILYNKETYLYYNMDVVNYNPTLSISIMQLSKYYLKQKEDNYTTLYFISEAGKLARNKQQNLKKIRNESNKRPQNKKDYNKRY